eukprot:SAG31_NODE_8158_length_1507_cov_0.975142_1_plen_67_part_10
MSVVRVYSICEGQDTHLAWRLNVPPPAWLRRTTHRISGKLAALFGEGCMTGHLAIEMDDRRPERAVA